jgi:hypothetical protein
MFSAQSANRGVSELQLVRGAFMRLMQAARKLIRDVRDGRKESRHRFEVEDLLTTVLLTTEEHALACRRLANAMQYAVEGETGAACFELRMLLRSLIRRERELSSAVDARGL